MAKIAIDLNKGTIDHNTDETIIGIDLGTTNSLVAVVVDGKPKALRDPYGNSTIMPSVVSFEFLEDKDSVLKEIIHIGHRATDNARADPSTTIYSVKRLFGKKYMELTNDVTKLPYRIYKPEDKGFVGVVVKDKHYSPVQISAYILKELKARTEKLLNKKITKAVITVPAYFDDIQRQMTRDAGKLAGLDVLRIINEPTAAALAYGYGKTNMKPKNIAVFDLGGGTFDVSILHLEKGVYEVLSTNGDTNLGGDDIDDAIMDHWEEIHELILTDEQYIDFRQYSEKAKINADKNEFKEKYKDVFLEMDEPLLLVLITPLFERIKTACHNAISDSKLTLDQIDEVVLVGGSTRLELVKKLVKDIFNQTPNDSLNPDEAVALGAAIQADVLGGNRKDILLLDVTPLSLGIETMGGLMDVIIPRNSKVPHSAGRSYTTSVDGQTNLKVGIYQGERDLIEFNRKLGEFILSGIPPMAAGLPKILIKFILNADGILEVTAIEERSGKEQTITIRSMYEMSEESMAQMLLDSFNNAKKDIEAKALIETRNEALGLRISVVKFINNNMDILDRGVVHEIQNHVMELNGNLFIKDRHKLQKIIDDLNAYSQPYAEEVMEIRVRAALKNKSIN